MSEAVAEQKAEVAKDAIVIAEIPELIESKWAEVAIIGSRHISQEMQNGINACLNLPLWEDGDHGVRSIVLGDLRLEKEVNGDTINPLGEAYPAGKCLVIDLDNIMKRAVVRSQNEMPNVSIYAWYYTNVLISILHEMHHLSQAAAGVNLNEHPNEEDAAEEFAHEQLVEVAKFFHIEPAEWTKEPFFRDAVLHDALEGEDEQWAEHQMDMLENRLFFHRRRTEETESVKCHTIKDYIRFVFTKDDPDDEAWLGTPVPEEPVGTTAAMAVGDNSMTELVKKAADVAVTGSGPVGVNVVLPESTPNAGVDAEELEESDVIGGGYEPEDDGSFDYLLNGNQIQTETVPSTGGAQAAKLTDVAGVNQQVMSGAQFCSNCGKQLDGNFCSGCGSPAVQQAPTKTPEATGPEVLAYQPTSMDDQTPINVVHGIYFKCYNHIFSYCGPYAGGFQHGNKVYELALPLEPAEAEAIIKMDCLDLNGRWCPGTPTSVQDASGKITARLLGGTMKATKMPYYKLYINFNGKELCRLLLPQNPQKVNAQGQFSKPALAAQQGARIMYVKEGNDAIVKAGGKEWIGKIVDNRWEA